MDAKITIKTKERFASAIASHVNHWRQAYRVEHLVLRI